MKQAYEEMESRIVRILEEDIITKSKEDYEQDNSSCRHESAKLPFEHV